MPRVALLALAVGLVLADSSVVTLGLPGVLADFSASPQDVAWVLTAYNLVLALAAVPAALLTRRAPASVLATAGLVVFAVASLLCAAAPSLGVLIAARCLQGLGGAAVACAALDLLVGATGSRARGVAVWGAAGALGAAVGPAAGGLLTEALSWEAIFAVQVPLALAAVASTTNKGLTPIRVEGAGDRPRWAELAALFFLGAGLTAALFLLVLLLISGWRVSPLVAALTVTVMPVAALAAGRFAGLTTRARGAAGAVLVAGGLAALGLLPGAHLAWTVAPQVLVGLGLGLSLAALTEAALRDRAPLSLHGGWTIAARHAGVVAALALLTPVFTADLERQEDRAAEAVLAVLLDSPLGATTKLDLGLELAGLLDTAEGDVPEVAPAFARTQAAPQERPTLQRLQARVEDELDRAATTAFGRSFLIAALLSLGALVPLLRRDAVLPTAAAVLASALLLIAFLAAGGGDFRPTPAPPPCGREVRSADTGVTGSVERIGLTAITSAACDLGIPRERLLLGLAGQERLAIDPERRTAAFRRGLRTAIDEEERSGRLGGTQAFLLRQAAAALPVDALVDRLFRSGGG